MGAGLLVHKEQVDSAADKIRYDALFHLKLDLTRLQNILYNLLTERSANLEEAKLNLSVTAMDDSIKTLMLVNESDSILMANRYTWEQKNAAEVSRYNPSIAQHVKATNTPEVFFEKPDNTSLKGYYPVILQIDDKNGLPVKRLGVLYAEVSIAHQLERAKNTATNFSFILVGTLMAIALIIATLLHLLVSRRLNKLISASENFAAGNRETTVSIGGNDELTVVGKAFNDMAKRISIDIQRRKDAESRLLELNETLEQRVTSRTKELENKKQELLDSQAIDCNANKMAALGEMASGIAHEINSPLQAINTLTYLIRGHIKKSQFDNIEESVSKIDSSVITVTNIIESLRKMSRDSSDDPFEIVQINEIITDATGISKVRYTSSGIRLEVIYHDKCEATSITCRRLQISQIIINLLNNAYDAAVDASEKWISIDIFCGDEALKISVTDSGSGVPSSIQDKIFDPMFTTKDIGKGTGLGLSISSEMARRNNGTLTLDTDSQNTCFTLTLTKNSQTNSNSPQQSEQPNG